MRRTGSKLGAIVAVVALACAKEKAEPPLSAPSRASESSGAPVVARFVDLSATPVDVRATVCDSVVVAVARGKAEALGEALGAGDVLFVQGPDPFAVKGEGLAVIATAVHAPCAPKARPAGPTKHVVRASAAPELVWAKGNMRAHLDLEASLSPELYVGRLEGTAPVAEHLHDTSWEILCAVEGAGTFTLGSKAARIGPRTIVTVPPGTKHAWQPDEGVKLVAVQLYTPPGPEQRFKGLAASDGGPPAPVK